ncbi:MAG: putative membrane transporter protein [Promethearchaeota archaeon]|nr:MAG: putative membrane transporter protein [Candidatus Lokiarchaeota archaeon]
MILQANDILLLFLIILLGFLGALSDSALGMGYGLLSPILLSIGLDPLIIVPVLLISQMTTGFTGTIFHSFYKNVDLSSKHTQDIKASVLFVLMGLSGMTLAVLLTINLSKEYVMLYIGIMVCVGGILMLPEINFPFSWTRLYVLSIIASFNKAISGGGYGPIMTVGQMTSGRESRESVAVTDLSEACLSGYGFILYLILNTFSENLLLTFELALIMILSGIVATPIGALFTKKLRKKVTKKIIGALSITIGIFTILRFIYAIL